MPDTTAQVDFIRDEVTERLAQYDLIDDCLEGEGAVKAKREIYLPIPNPDDTSDKNKKRYDAYLKRAHFYNVAQRTWRGLVGQAFQKEVTLELDPLLEGMRASADGSATTLVQQMKRADGEVLGKGRVGLLADFPKVDGPVSREQLNRGEVQPTISLYTASNIINWRVAKKGSKVVLTKLVLHESKEVDDGFALTYEDRWRVLELINGRCTVVVYKAAKDVSGGFDVDEELTEVHDSNDAPIGFIPFIAVGAENNDLDVDRPPLYDICSLNIAHYRNSADWEESCFVVGQATPVVAGLTDDWYDQVMQKRIAFGSRGGIPLPVGGSADLLQADPNSMAAEGMKDKERRMLSLGAKLLESKQVQQTASEVRINYATELSVVQTIAQNLATAYQQLLDWCGLFVGATKPTKVELPVDFSLGQLTPQELQALSTLRQNKDLAPSEVRALLIKMGWATLPLEDFQAEIAAQLDYSVPPPRLTMPPNGNMQQQEDQQQQQQA